MKSLHERLSRFSWPWQTPRLKLDAAFEIESQEATIRRLVREVAFLEKQIARMDQEAFELREANAQFETSIHRLSLALENATSAAESALEARSAGRTSCPVAKSWPQVKREKEIAMAKKAPAPPPMPAGKGKGKKGC